MSYYSCPTDDFPCEVVALFADHVQEDPQVIWRSVQELEILPCRQCRQAEQDIAGLRGVRLGKLERQILRGAPGRDQPSQVLEPAGESIADAEGHRRAQRKLRRIGLLSASRWFLQSSARDRRRRLVRLTPLGEAVVALLGDSLKTGRPIRWEKHLDALKVRVRLSPQTLLAQFQSEVEECLKFLSRWTAMLQRRRWSRRAMKEQVELEERLAVLGAISKAIAKAISQNV